MAYGQLPNMGRSEAFRLVEATPNAFDDTGSFDDVAFASMTFQVAEQKEITQEVGRPLATDVRHHSAHITGQINLPMRYDRAVSDFLAAAMRDTIVPAEVSVTPAAVSFLNSVAHVDGGANGPQLLEVGSTTAWDALEAASSLADLESALLVVSDAATAGNNSVTRGPLLVKAANPRIISSDQAIDLDPRLHNTADGWGGTFTEDTADALTVSAGSYIGLRNAVPAGNPTYSLIIRIADIATAQYFTLTGITLAGPSLGVNNRGNLEWQIPYAAAGWTNLTVTDPASGGTYQDTINVYNPIISGGAQITKILVASDSEMVALEGDEVSGLVWGAPGAVTMVHDTHGQDTASGYWLGVHQPVFGFTYHVANAAAPKGVTLQGWANAHTPVLAIVELTDSDSNVIYLKANKVKAGSTILPSIGGEGPHRGTWAGDVMEDTRTGLAWTYHEFAAA